MVRRTVFEDIELQYRGKTHRIKANEVLPALASVESIIAFNELIDLMQKGQAPMARIAMAYASLLNHAGASVTPDLVYLDLFPDGEDGGNMLQAVETLVSMFVPPDKMATIQGEAKPADISEASPSRSSKGRTKPSSKTA